jgi:hypothetical protein
MNSLGFMYLLGLLDITDTRVLGGVIPSHPHEKDLGHLPTRQRSVNRLSG